MKIKIDFTPYYEWYAKWIDWKKVSVNDFINGRIENPFSMLSEWLDIVSVKINRNIIGKEIYYSLNAEHRDTITYDTYIEGKDYICSKNTILFDKLEYCILHLHYDGTDIFEGNELLPMFTEDLFTIEI